MALRVWLPLNGNFHNQGLGTLSAPFSMTGNTWEAGKIGNNLKIAKNKSNTVNLQEIVDKDTLTCCLWFKLTLDSTFTAWQDLCSFGVKKVSSGSTGSMRLEVQNAAGSSVRWYANGLMATDIVSQTGNTVLGQWYHMALVITPTKSYTYFNGTYLGEWTLNNDFAFSGNIALGDTGNMYCTLADFRVYDEALSAKQIKEISKGLVAHYPLKGTCANPNLLVGAMDRTKWTYESCTRVNDANPEVVSFTVSSANQRIYLGVSNVWSSGQKYTYSFDAKASVDNAQLDASRSIVDFGPTHSLTTEWKHYTGLISSTGTSDTGTLSIRGRTANATYYLKNIKLENGEIETNYIPNVADSKYVALGYDKVWATDSSGNGFNGIATGTLSYNIDSPKYNGSTKFDGSTGYIAVGRPMPKDALTINVWASMENWSNYNGRIGSCTEGGGWNFEKTSSAMNFALGVGTSSNAYTTNFTSSQTPLSELTSGWHMFTGTFDGMYKKIYIDGVLKGETNTCQNGTTLTTATPIFYNANNGVFIGAEAGGNQTTPAGSYFNGSISDFRIYATALSADEILTMYKNSGIIDNNGNMYSYEFEDVAENMAWRANNSIINKKWENGLAKVTQANVTCTLTDEGIRIVRTPNVASADHNMWGGFCWRLRSDPLKDILTKGHKYIILYDVKGKTNQGQFTGWDNNMGWGGGGLTPQPTNVVYSAIPVNFNNDEWTTFFYKWDLTDDVYKVCTKSYSSFVEGTTYLSYSDFQIGWNYGDTGEWGTDIYVKNLRLYDITNLDNPKLLETGEAIAGNINEIGDKTKIRQIGYDANSFIEI